jgi:primosomal protein N' (replication factor Y)
LFSVVLNNSKMLTVSDAIAKVVVDLALDREFDYRIPAALAGQVRVGSRVRVPLGRRLAQGYVVGLAA